MAIIDTGASDHYFTSTAPLLHINMVAPPTTICTASGKACTSSATMCLAIPAIPTLHAHTGHIMLGFSNNLISLEKLCNAGCMATVDKNQLLVHDPHGNTILQGIREPSGAHLWRATITAPPTPPRAGPPRAPPSPQPPAPPRLFAHV